MLKKTSNILLVAESISAFGAGLFMPIFAIFSEQLGGDITDAGIAAGIFLFVTSALQVPIGSILDKYPKKYFLVAAYLLAMVTFLGYMFISSKYELFVLQVILGVANALGDPAWEALFGNASLKKNTGSAWAKYHYTSGFATAFAIVLGSIFADRYGFQLLFLLGAIHSCIAAVITWTYLEKIDFVKAA